MGIDEHNNEGSGLELYPLSDVLDILGKKNKVVPVKQTKF